MFNYRTSEHPAYRPDLVQRDYNPFTILKENLVATYVKVIVKFT
jgi:hypothetical protein